MFKPSNRIVTKTVDSNPGILDYKAETPANTPLRRPTTDYCLQGRSKTPELSSRQ